MECLIKWPKKKKKKGKSVTMVAGECKLGAERRYSIELFNKYEAIVC